MNRAKAILSKAFLLTLLLGTGAVLFAPREAQAQVVVFRPPSPVFVATARPEYYGGHPVYYHHDNWYYRDNRGWNYYRSEPRYLHERRGTWGERRGYSYRR
jgi:hypothetical protein